MKEKIVHITFWDHAEEDGREDSGAILTEVWGKLTGESELEYEVQSWMFDKNPDHPQNKVFSIVKGAVIKLRRLR